MHMREIRGLKQDSYSSNKKGKTDMTFHSLNQLEFVIDQIDQVPKGNQEWF